MRTFRVIALSCNSSKKGVLESGQTVTEDAFEEGEADKLVEQDFLVEVTEGVKEKQQPKKEGTKVEGKGILSDIRKSVGV